MALAVADILLAYFMEMEENLKMGKFSETEGGIGADSFWIELDGRNETAPYIVEGVVNG